MDFKTTYYVGEAFERGAFRTKEVDPILGGGKVIDLTCGTWVPPVPLRFRQYEGKQLLDCIGTQWANILLSDRAIDVLRGSGATGWDTYPISLEAKDGSPVAGYHGLMVRGRCGPIDNTRSVEVDTIVPGSARGHVLKWKGMYFKEDSWDGSDVFRPEATGYIFVTQKVREAFERAKITNLRVTALADFERFMLT